MSGILLRDAEVEGQRVDVRISDGAIVEIAPGLVVRGEEVVDVGGGAVLPGLHDHHIHLLALAAAHGSIQVGPPGVATVDELTSVLRSAPPGSGRAPWIRGVGYHESVAGDLDRDSLDALVRDRPVRIQHRSGALWVLNTPALDAIGLDAMRPGAGEPEGVERDPDGRPTGRFWRVDHWLREVVPPDAAPDLARVGRELLRWGVTGVTDATPTEDHASLDLLSDAVTRGALTQRVVATGGPALAWTDLPGVQRGPVKVLLPDHEDPSFDRMVAAVRTARNQGRAVAVHAVTAATAAMAIAAIDEVGPMDGDRIEHGAVLSVGLAAALADRGIAVVTNPGFVHTRGDQYLTDVEPDERPDLWRCQTLVDAGVALGAGTDAPFGDSNPWKAIAAGADRHTISGRVLGAEEAVSAYRALALFLGAPSRPGGTARRVEPGAPADLCVLAAPLAVELREPAAVQPACTIVGGRIHRW